MIPIVRLGHEILAGQRLFLGPDFRDQHLHETPPALSEVSGPLSALIAQCLNKDRGSRPSAAEVSRRLGTMAGQTGYCQMLWIGREE